LSAWIEGGVGWFAIEVRKARRRVWISFVFAGGIVALTFP
jgi:hypothetical protein